MKKVDRANIVSDYLDKIYPEVPIPLKHKSTYELLIAVLLSAQCTDERVNKITPLLFKIAKNPFDMSKVPVNKIYKIIRPCGLAPKKSNAISQLSKILVKKNLFRLKNSNHYSIESLSLKPAFQNNAV